VTQSSVSPLQVSNLSRSFSGNLYFILGPGLGDTVNDFRVLHEVLSLFPQAVPVIYADQRWESLYELVPECHGRTIHHYHPARSGQRVEGSSEAPYHHTFQELMRAIEKEAARSEAYVAIGGFKCSDQLARREGGLANKARAIGLPLPVERCRPYVPLGSEQLAQANHFLKDHRLERGHYLVLAPYTLQEKMWPMDQWESLVDQLEKELKIPMVIVGLPGNSGVSGSRVVSALGLPLQGVAGLLAQARGFIGLDSGLTHLAACFDIPLIALNPNARFPPFLVQADSPFRWTILPPGIYGSVPLDPSVVAAVTLAGLASQKPPACPLCRSTPYILSARKDSILFLCRCGILFRRPEPEPVGTYSTAVDSGQVMLPIAERDLEMVRDILRKAKTDREGLRGSPMRIAFDHWDPVSLDPDRLLEDTSDRNLWWTWDGVYGFLKQEGLTITQSSVHGPGQAPHITALEMMVGSVPLERPDPELAVPWGTDTIMVLRSTYERWLSWGAFRNQAELEGLGWMLAQRGEGQVGKSLLSVVLRHNPRWRTLTRWIRAWWMGRHAGSQIGAA